jgi:membrane peptidoglycan carboxypeptidase
VHPLELWLVGYLRANPKATLGDAVAASQDIRQETYGWLFKSGKKRAQDVRLRSMLEVDAFGEIQRDWKRLGYPFDALTPSYATAIGASGDRPAALAELIGIVLNRGRRLAVAKLESLEFAVGTPYETRLRYRPAQAERVLPEEVAATVRRALLDVVQEGTARRLRGGFERPNGGRFDVGGKTGTGDHRFEVYGAGGRLVASRIVGRSATFVFLIGEKYFGTVMVYAHQPFAAKYRFTSALPVQLLKSLLPAILPILEQGACSRTEN